MRKVVHAFYNDCRLRSLYHDHLTLKKTLLSSSQNPLRNFSMLSSDGKKVKEPEDLEEIQGEKADMSFFESLEDIKVSVINDSILRIRLNRPHRMNALSEKMGESIISLSKFLQQKNDDSNHLVQSKDKNKIASLQKASSYRCVIFEGSEDSFSTGRDLKDSKLHTTQSQKDYYMKTAQESVMAVLNIPIPTISLLSGANYGWGVELALATDIRYATSSAIFCLPECSLGIFPGAYGCVLLPKRIISPALARELIFTSRSFSAQEAFKYGILNDVVNINEADDREKKGGDTSVNNKKKIFFQHLRQRGLDTAKAIVKNGPLGLIAAKKLMNRIEDENLNLLDSIQLSDTMRAPLSNTADFKEALQAFGEKRQPLFTGR